jgi:perosamine synthetase
MKYRKILIVGASGTLGSSWLAQISRSSEHTAIAHCVTRAIDWFDGQKVVLDLISPGAIKKLIDQTKPDLVINASGATSVDLCEDRPSWAYALNETLPRQLAQQCVAHGCRLVHISTDHIFGCGSGPFAESESPSPINTYGKSKRAGEVAVLEEAPESLIIRTNFFASPRDGDSTFISWLISGLEKNESRNLFHDVYFTPIFVDTLIFHVHALLESDCSGLINVGGPEQLSKFEFGKRVARAFGYTTENIFPVSIEDVRDLCRRPNHMGLACSKLKSTLMVDLPTLDSDIRLLVDKIPELIVSPERRKGLNVRSGSVLSYGRHVIDRDDIDSVVRCLKSSNLTQGQEVQKFERDIANAVNAKYAVAVASCTAGLHLACKVAGLKKGMKGITTPLSFVSTSNALLYTGATPMFVDIDPDSLNLDILKAKTALANDTNIKAVLPVHFAGAPCEMKAIKELGDRHDCVIIEDAAHALGARYRSGDLVGSCKYSDMTVFSFHPVKHVAAGEGGMVTTNNEEYYRRLLRLRSHGIIKDINLFESLDQALTDGEENPWYYEMQELGMHYRITDIQCALGSSQLSKLPAFVHERRRLVERYDQAFARCPLIKRAQLDHRGLSSHHLFVIQCDFKALGVSRAAYMQKIRDEGVGSQVHYLPIPMHPYYQGLGYTMSGLANAAKYYQECLSLPLYFDLTMPEQNHVIEVVLSNLEQAN